MTKPITADPAAPIFPLTNGSIEDHATTFVEEGSLWVQDHWLDILIAGAFAALIIVGLHVMRSWALKLCRRSDGSGNWYSIFGRAIARTGNFFIVMAALRLVSGYAQATPTIHNTITFLFTIAAVFQAAIWAREIIFGLIENRTQSEGYQGEGLASALGIIRLLITIALFAIAVVVVLSNVGVNVTGLVAGLGVGGIAIGLAAQGIFADLFAALAILFDKPFRLGDSISYDKGAGSGTVEAIGLKSTRIRGGAGEQRIVANRRLLDFEILNTTDRTYNRLKFDFHLGYGTSADLVEQLPEILKKAVESCGYKLVHAGLNGFAESGLSYDVEFQSKKADFPADARDKVGAAILRSLAEHKVSFAYPTRVNLVAEKTKPVPPARPEREITEQ